MFTSSVVRLLLFVLTPGALEQREAHCVQCCPLGKLNCSVVTTVLGAARSFGYFVSFQPILDTTKPKLAPLNEGGTAELLTKVRAKWESSASVHLWATQPQDLKAGGGIGPGFGPMPSVAQRLDVVCSGQQGAHWSSRHCKATPGPCPSEGLREGGGWEKYLYVCLFKSILF